MQDLTEEGRSLAAEVAGRHGVRVETVGALLTALAAGQGTQAQFDIPELGGMGQWSRGGMTMVGDMFNQGLRARVDALCSELSGLIGAAQSHAPAGSQDQGGVGLFVAANGGDEDGWPRDLGAAASTGSQNDMRYAVFPQTRRLAVRRHGRVTVYDTGDHRIGGVSQQQSGDQSLSFTSQHGLVRVADLPLAGAAAAAASEPAAAPARSEPEADAAPAPAPPGSEDVFAKLERLAELRQKGILTDLEFEAKKTELLARL